MDSSRLGLKLGVLILIRWLLYRVTTMLRFCFGRFFFFFFFFIMYMYNNVSC